LYFRNAADNPKSAPTTTSKKPSELAWEISASSPSYDLNVKLRVYRRNGAKEHVVWRVLDEAIDWFVLRGSDYVKLMPDADGLLKSEQFPGLWVHPEQLVRKDVESALKPLDRGLASAEYQAFVKRLNFQPKK
jgi:hypothetical protein